MEVLKVGQLIQCHTDRVKYNQNPGVLGSLSGVYQLWVPQKFLRNSSSSFIFFFFFFGTFYKRDLMDSRPQGRFLKEIAPVRLEKELGRGVYV